MQLNGTDFQGDGRTIPEVAAELGLSEQTIAAVQRDADRPDKIAMNVWRYLCPTIDDKLYVGSIKKIPVSTLQNIYGNSFDLIK